MTKPLKAWWFAATRRLPNGDQRHIRVGRTHVHRGDLVLCESGLHASRRIVDALDYAPGHLLCRVECAGDIREDRDKLVCTRRKYLALVDATAMLRKFAHLCALDVIDLWEAPDVVRRYLRTGDESLRDAARDAGMAAAAARAAAMAAAAARDAAMAAAAARAAARDAAAARAAARDAAAAGDAARAAQNRRLTRMANKLIAESRCPD